MQAALLTVLRGGRQACGLWALLCCLPVFGQAVAPDGTQDIENVKQVAENHARELLRGEGYADIEVKAGAMDARLRLKACEVPLAAFSNNNSGVRGGRTTVGVRCTGSSPWTLYVPVTVVAQTTVVLVQGPLPRGTLLNDSHVRLVARPLTELPHNALAKVEQVVGRELVRAIDNDTLASANLLKTRELVAKGQEVIILAQGANLEVRMAGVALEKGQIGDRIAVRNTNSGRTVEGLILNETTVRVQL
jgi:flagella basal body P-ring formation protein FlgA